ncbi:MAG: hypothetical protein WBP44_05330 [Gammaproteobacteria bacterium]|jgi:hypothetical protein
MFSSNKNMQSIVSNFHLDHMMRYSLFAPRLYNLCRSLGFEAGNIIPSRAFCSDKNQGSRSFSSPSILAPSLSTMAALAALLQQAGMARMQIMARTW